MLTDSLKLTAPGQGASAARLQPQVGLTLWLASFLFIEVALLALAGPFILLDGDSTLHIVIGRQIWEARALPHADTLTHTFYGQPWIAKEWLSQLILYAAWAVGSWRAVVLVTVTGIATAFSLLFVVLARQLRITVAFGITLLSVVLTLGHFLARPHIFSFPLIILWFAGLVSAVEHKARPSLWLLLVMTLWSNLHAGFTLGLAIAGILALEAVYASERGDRVRTAITWGAFLCAALIAACITPYGYEPLLLTFKLYGAQPVQFIQEWAPFNANKDPIFEIAVLGLIALALFFGVKIRPFRLLLLIILIHLAFKHVRMIEMFAMIAPILIASSLAGQFKFLRLSTQQTQDPQLFAFLHRISGLPGRLVLLAMISIAALLFGTRGGLEPAQYAELKPAVDFLEKSGLTNRIFNSYSFAGYLMYRDVKVFMDSRVDQLFTGGFFQKTIDAIKGSGSGLSSLLAAQDIRIALVEAKSAEATQLRDAPHWSLAYSDEFALVFVRR